MMMLFRLLRASLVATGAVAVFAVCDDFPTGPESSDVPRLPRPMLNTTGGGSAVLVAAGDIAQCNTTSPATLNDEATAQLLRALPEATVATLGDHSNVNSGSFITPAGYTDCYGPSWGTPDILPRTRPTPGDRDWNAPAGSTPGQVYFDYFNGVGVVDGPAGPRSQGYYAYDVGTWRVIVLNNNISTAVNSSQYLWLKQELAANPAECTIAYWHAPRFFSAGATIRNQVKPLWDLLYAAGAEIILGSDNRFYERFAPQTPEGVVDQNFGIRQFIVGTGGIGISTPISPPRANSEKLISPTFGILKLTLHETGYNWDFLTIPSRPLSEPETGSGTCHASPFPAARPNGPYASEKTVTFDGRGSLDPQGDALTYEWNFGDNSTHVGNQPVDATPTHTYAADGVYTVTLTVVDPNGERSEPATTTATIGNIPPAVNAGVDISALPNTEVMVQALFSDPGLDDAVWSYSIDWGDGSELTTGTLPTQDGPVLGTHTYRVANTYSVIVEVTDKDGGVGSDVVMVQVSDQPTGTYVLTGAGDIAECDVARVSQKTAQILKATPGTVFTLGDNAYPDGTAQQYRDCYGPSWGDPSIKSRTFPTLGNHDYNTPGAGPSFDYFGAALGSRGKGYYSYDVGAWHVIVLNNNNGDLVPSSPGSAQFEWLKADLARSASTSRCTIVMAHQPYMYSSSTVDAEGIRPKHKPIWEELYKWGVELILAGDVHRYERFRPQTPNAEADDAYGIRQFLVGTGGAGTGMPGTIRVHSEIVSAAHGVLRLTLEPSRYTWKFIPIEGQTFTDEGSGTCHDPKPSEPVNQAPQANADQYTVAEDNTLSVTTAISAIGVDGVLGNDVDADGDALTAAVLNGAGPTNGTLDFNTNGTFTYTPTLNFHGEDQFTYEASDGKGGLAAATVTITVTPVNDAPVANNDAGYSIGENQTLTTDVASGVLANDTDVESAQLTAELVQGPASGTLSLSADGSFTYAPNANFNGTDSFQYRASDGSLGSNTATVTIAITEVDNAPVAVDDPSYSVPEDETLTTPASVLANDTDGDGDALEATLVAGPPAAATASFTLQTDGTFSYAPAANFTGTVAFTYEARDPDGTSSNVATVTIAVTPVNDAPVADAQSVSTGEDAPVSITVGGSDVDGDALTFSIAAPPTNGTLAAAASPGTYTYTPNAEFSGSDEFTFTASDGSAESAPATVSINVGGVNDAPVGVDNAYRTSEDTPLTVPAAGVLTNDSDPDAGTVLQAVLATGPANGTVDLGANGSLVYTPNANVNGTDRFTYKATDGALESGVTTVTITIDPVNDAPTANGDSYTTAEDQPLTVVTASGVLQNDGDVDGDELSAALVSGPTNGTLALSANGSFTYTPNANHSGSDGFSYRTSDGALQSNVATVTITIGALNDGPVADAQTITTDEDTPATVTLAGADPEGNALSYRITTQPSHGTLSGEGNVYIYTAAANYSGNDAFSFVVNDGAEDSPEASVSITVSPVNDAPVAADNAYSTSEDTPLTVPAAGVLANDSDADAGSVLQAVLVTGPTNGTLDLRADGSLVYTPNANFNGTDSFTYQATDGALGSATATVRITVGALNDAPVADGDSYSTPEDQQLTVAAPGVLQNDRDGEGDGLSAVLISGPANGTLALNADGSFTYMPNANHSGSDGFSYRTSDGALQSNVATVTITISAVNDGPVADAQSVETAEDTPVSVVLTGSDVDGDALTFSIATAPAHGTLAAAASPGTYTYTPNANFNGRDEFTFTTSDGSPSAAAMVTIAVGTVNDAPIASADQYAVDEDNVLNGAQSVLANDADADGDPLTASLVADRGPSNGTLTLNADGTFTYTPNADFNGTDGFSYTVSDGSAVSNAARVEISVAPVNDAPVAQPQSVTVDEDETVTITLAGQDIENSQLAYTITTEPAHGSLSAEGNVYTYTPDANYLGSDAFSFVVNDGTDDSAPVTVSITVSAVNDAPTATADGYSTAEETALTVAAPGILSNDSDADGDAITAAVVAQPEHGTLTLNANGSFTYVPLANFAGDDSFTYQATDPSGGASMTITVSIAVTPVNDAPVVDPIASQTRAEATLVTFAAAATDPDANATNFSLIGAPAGATIDAATGVFTWTPSEAQGPATYAFAVRATDDGTPSLTGDQQVTITITEANAAPALASIGSKSVVWGNTLTFTATATDTDEPANALTFSLLDGPAGATINGSTGEFSWTPGATQGGGTYVFTVRASDGGLNADEQITVTVMIVNTAPQALNDAATVAEDGSQTIQVLTNDVDAEGDALSTTMVDGPDHGTVVHNADGSFSYTPAANFNGTDVLTYQTSDGALTSNTATVTITVTAVNDAPTAAANSYNADEDKPLVVDAPGVLANDADLDGQQLSAVLVSGPANGTLALNGNGSFTYTPKLHFSGNDAFSYRASDGLGSSDAVSVAITVRARMTVALDIIPGSSTNSIGYSTSQTEIVFAVLSSATFDATLVDPATVTVGNDQGTDTPLAKNADGSFKFMLVDVTGDGRRDFYAYVNKAAMKANGDLTLATTSMTVLGRLKAPRTELFRGKDKVTVVP